jgi:seryl-tRNA synthetase
VIDRRLLLDDYDTVARRYARRGVSAEAVAELRDAVTARRQGQRAVDDLRADLNRRSEAVGALMREGKKAEGAEARAAVGKVKEELAGAERALAIAEEREEYLFLRSPNLPSEDAPDGLAESNNVVRSVHGFDEAAYAGRTWRPHWEIAAELGIFDGDRAGKISGSMFSLFLGDGARLLRALIQFGLDLNRDRFLEVAPPHLVKTDTFVGTGHLPKFEIDAYRLRDDDLWLIPTGEVPLMGIHREEILDVEALPKRYMAYTVCFRREAGSAGKDTRGLQRLHEFHKVEMLELCAPEQVQAEFDAMVAAACRPLELLGLPYRIVDLCCGDLTFSSARVFDLEVYAPGVQRWLEVSSVGQFTDFQARRGNIRFRRGTSKPEFCHALNGSALATPRVWAAIIEHGQQDDGTVRIPAPLVPYMGGNDVIRPRT